MDSKGIVSHTNALGTFEVVDLLAATAAGAQEQEQEQEGGTAGTAALSVMTRPRQPTLGLLSRNRDK